MRGWIILFFLLTMAFLIPVSGAANEPSTWQGCNVSGLAVFGTLAAVCVATLIGRQRA